MPAQQYLRSLLVIRQHDTQRRLKFIGVQTKRYGSRGCPYQVKSSQHDIQSVHLRLDQLLTIYFHLHTVTKEF